MRHVPSGRESGGMVGPSDEIILPGTLGKGCPDGLDEATSAGKGVGAELPFMQSMAIPSTVTVQTSGFGFSTSFARLHGTLNWLLHCNAHDSPSMLQLKFMNGVKSHWDSDPHSLDLKVPGARESGAMLQYDPGSEPTGSEKHLFQRCRSGSGFNPHS